MGQLKIKKTAVACLTIVALLTFAAALGWWNFLSAQMVSRGDIREACYLAVAFEEYYQRHGAMPSEADVQLFPSRLQFLRLHGDRYLFTCGLYGRDLLAIQFNGNGESRFNFMVLGDGNS